LAFDETSDLAVLMSSEKPQGWASLRGGGGPGISESILLPDFPIGTVSALTGLGNDQRMIQINTPRKQRNDSGSPLLDQSGNVVGIVAGNLSEIQVVEGSGDITQNASFAVNLETIQSFLDSHAVPYILNNRDETKKLSEI